MHCPLQVEERILVWHLYNFAARLAGTRRANQVIVGNRAS